MKVSAKSEYGVRAMVLLARSYGQGPIPLNQVAERERIPLPFLGQLMIPLLHDGMVTSVRGAHGGYQLARDPADISVGEVMRSIDGPIALSHCLEFGAGEQGTCGMGVLIVDCTTRDVWAVLQEKISQMLDTFTLADLCHKPDVALRLPRPENPAAVAIALAR